MGATVHTPPQSNFDAAQEERKQRAKGLLRTSAADAQVSHGHFTAYSNYRCRRFLVGRP